MIVADQYENNTQVTPSSSPTMGLLGLNLLDLLGDMNFWVLCQQEKDKFRFGDLSENARISLYFKYLVVEAFNMYRKLSYKEVQFILDEVQYYYLMIH